jgi:molybdate transport system substrate-binding protein
MKEPLSRRTALSRLAALGLPFVAPLACDRRGEASELVVLAASSLREVFASLAKAFEREHPGVRVSLSFAGSHELRAQIERGAPADVFASADQKQIDALTRAGLVAMPRCFAKNVPVLVVAPEAAGTLRSLGDLPRARRIVVGATESPIGAYTAELFARAEGTYGAGFRREVEANIVSREPSVRQVLAKVSLGEADAGLAYRSDALVAAERVTLVELPRELQVVAEYFVATVTRAKSDAFAEAFVALVCSPEGQRVLTHAGFLGAGDLP